LHASGGQVHAIKDGIGRANAAADLGIEVHARHVLHAADADGNRLMDSVGQQVVGADDDGRVGSAGRGGGGKQDQAAGGRQKGGTRRLELFHIVFLSCSTRGDTLVCMKTVVCIGH